MAYQYLNFHRLYHFLLFLLVATLFLNSSHVRGRFLEPEKRDNSNNNSTPPKGTVKTIEDDDGEVIDCVDVYKQPALDHPLLKDHTIQLDPSSSPKKMNQSISDLIQPWQKNGVCSEHTVPIRRRRQLQDQSTQTQSNDTITGPHFEVAKVVAFPASGSRFYGGSGTFSIWDPAVSRLDDLSQSSLLVSLSPGVFLLTGWIVFPAKYEDNRPRLFTYFTTDDSITTRCWDLECNGFVQVNNKYALGSIISTISTVGGPIYVLEIQIYQDRATGNWWVSILDTPIGYWPASLFSGIPEGAETLQWGGTVYDSVGEGPHTATDMGNGLFPDVGTDDASYVCSLQYVDDSFTLRTPDLSSLALSVTNPLCYNARVLPGLDPKLGLCFRYGGSGRNRLCP